MKLINLSEKTIDIKDMNPEQKEQYKNSPVEIVAVLSNHQYQMIRTGEADIIVPHGVEMSNKAGSKTLVFACPNRDVAEELIDGLDNSGMVWEEEVNEKVNLSDILDESGL